MSADLELSVITSSSVFCSLPHVRVKVTLKPCQRVRVFYTKLELLSYVIFSFVAGFK